MASDPGPRTAFRRAMQVALKAYFVGQKLEIDFVPGALEGPQTDRDIGCVWFDQKRPEGRDMNNEIDLFGVRVFRRFRQEQGSDSDRETTEFQLELTFEILEDALRALINRPLLDAAAGVTLDPNWFSFFVVQQVVVRRPWQCVEATLQPWARNRTSRGG